MPEAGDFLGKTLDSKYKILEVIDSKGEMSWVFKATNLDLQGDVALKLFHVHEDDLEYENCYERFRREVVALVNCHHPNVVTVYDAKSQPEDKHKYIVEEFIVGENLWEYVRTRGPIHWEEAIPLFLQMISGIQAFHKKEIVDRDVKPSNFMRDEETGVIKVIDLNIAHIKYLKGITGNSVLGTYAWMSPEQLIKDPAALGIIGHQDVPMEVLLEHDIDERTDVFGLASVMYFMLTNELPFDGSSDLEIAFARLRSMPVPLLKKSIIQDSMPPDELIRLIEGGLVADPRKRIKNINEMRKSILEIERAPKKSLGTPGTSKDNIRRGKHSKRPDKVKPEDIKTIEQDTATMIAIPDNYLRPDINSLDAYRFTFALLAALLLKGHTSINARQFRERWHHVAHGLDWEEFETEALQSGLITIKYLEAAGAQLSLNFASINLAHLMIKTSKVVLLLKYANETVQDVVDEDGELKFVEVSPTRGLPENIVLDHLAPVTEGNYRDVLEGLEAIDSIRSPANDDLVHGKVNIPVGIEEDLSVDYWMNVLREEVNPATREDYRNIIEVLVEQEVLKKPGVAEVTVDELDNAFLKLNPHHKISKYLGNAVVAIEYFLYREQLGSSDKTPKTLEKSVVDNLSFAISELRVKSSLESMAREKMIYPVRYSRTLFYRLNIDDNRVEGSLGRFDLLKKLETKPIRIGSLTIFIVLFGLLLASSGIINHDVALALFAIVGTFSIVALIVFFYKYGFARGMMVIRTRLREQALEAFYPLSQSDEQLTMGHKLARIISNFLIDSLMIVGMLTVRVFKYTFLQVALLTKRLYKILESKTSQDKAEAKPGIKKKVARKKNRDNEEVSRSRSNSIIKPVLIAICMLLIAVLVFRQEGNAVASTTFAGVGRIIGVAAESITSSTEDAKRHIQDYTAVFHKWQGDRAFSGGDFKTAVAEYNDALNLYSDKTSKDRLAKRIGEAKAKQNLVQAITSADKLYVKGDSKGALKIVQKQYLAHPTTDKKLIDSAYKYMQSMLGQSSTLVDPLAVIETANLFAIDDFLKCCPPAATARDKAFNDKLDGVLLARIDSVYECVSSWQSAADKYLGIVDSGGGETTGLVGPKDDYAANIIAENNLCQSLATKEPIKRMFQIVAAATETSKVYVAVENSAIYGTIDGREGRFLLLESYNQAVGANNQIQAKLSEVKTIRDSLKVKGE